MSWISELPWDQPSVIATSFISHAKEWYATHNFGQYALAIIVIFWAGHIFSQLLPQDPTKPPVIFHLFPWVGSMVTYGMEPYQFFINAQKKYGEYFTFVLGGRRMHVALGPKGNDLVLNAKLAQVSAEEAYTPLTTPVFGTGVVYDCPNHVLMQQKKFVKYGMTTEAFKSYVPLIVEEVTNYFNTSPNFGKDKMRGKADAMATSPQITIFTASRTLQGPEVRKYFDASFAKLYKDLDNGFTPVNFLFPYLPLPANRKRDFAQRKMASIYRDIITQRRAMKEEDHPPDMIWNLMNQQYKDGRPTTDQEVAHMMIALLMAGQHTSMATSAWTILHLGAKPEYMYHPTLKFTDVSEKLYEEQKRVLGDEPLQYHHLKDMTLLNDVIREVLRLHPPLHSLIRKIIAPLPIEGTDYVLPAGDFLMCAPGVSAIDPEYWDDPLEFIPERWAGRKVDEEAEEKVDFGYGLVSKGGNSPYLPFGAGRHRCIGEQFANIQLGTIISTFVKELKWTANPQVPKPDYTSLVALPPHPAIYEWERRVQK